MGSHSPLREAWRLSALTIRGELCAQPSSAHQLTDLLDLRMIIQTIRRALSRSVQIDDASNLSSPDPSRADHSDLARGVIEVQHREEPHHVRVDATFN